MNPMEKSRRASEKVRGMPPSSGVRLVASKRPWAISSRPISNSRVVLQPRRWDAVLTSRLVG